MVKTDSVIKRVHYVTYEYENTAEKEQHILEMAKEDYECLERFEDAQKVVYRKFW